MRGAGKAKVPPTVGAQQRAAKFQRNPRGRPSISTQWARDNSNARGAIEAYVTSKSTDKTTNRNRKRAAASSSPEEKTVASNPAKKTNAKASPSQTLQSHQPSNTEEVEFPAMDKLLDEIRRMREENSKQFANMSKQLEESAVAHDRKLAELSKELQNYKEDSERGNKNLQKQIHALQKETRDSNATLTERVKSAEARITNTQSQVSHPNIDLLLDTLEQLEKDAKKLNLFFKGLDISRGSAKTVADRFIADEFTLQNKIVEARFLPWSDANTSKKGYSSQNGFPRVQTVNTGTKIEPQGQTDLH